jgi:hypothetical protein
MAMRHNVQLDTTSMLASIPILITVFSFISSPSHFLIKGKVYSRTGHEGPEGRIEVNLYSFFNLSAR